MDRAEEILAFWFGKDAEPRKEWFLKSAAFDAEIRERFFADYLAAIGGELRGWQTSASASLAFILLVDQFPRNMFRGEPAAFAGDSLALAAAMRAIENGFDRVLPPLRRAFIYLPFEHSENLADQERAVELFEAMRGQPEVSSMIDYAYRHREIIARFGRFPHRNQILGRDSTPEEAAYLRQPGSSF